MKKNAIHTDHAPKAVGPYSQAIEVGGLLYCSGQIAIDSKTGELSKGPIEEQVKIIMHNLKAVIEKAGGTLDNVMKTTIYITDMADYPKVNETYGSFFKEPYPARATVQVAALPKGAQVEIEAFAYIPVKSNCDCGDEGCGCC